MNSDQWQRVETLYHAALERELDARPSFLRATCSDEQVRLEVATLLEYDSQAKSFIETPALRRAAREVAGELELEPDSVPPHEIGPYRLLAPIGCGGMGEVHLALDTRLNRKVAIKFLPSAFTPETEQGRRFKQEARATSALSHPNIVTVFEVGELNGRHYIVSEYVEGETLRQLIHSDPKRGLELSSALPIAAQVARALEAAHNLGIIHRDIKPENVVVRRDGLVKVLDFGLAKLESEELGETGSQSQQLLTRTGVVMGTAAYMSPEQARGQKIDHRADIFSFGAMTYEMLSGERPFAGATTSDVIAAVLIKDPEPLGKVAPQVRPSLAAIIHRCLEKQPEKRFQSAGELASTLQGLTTLSTESQGLASKLTLSAVVGWPRATWLRMRQRPKYWIIAAVAGMLLIAMATLAGKLLTSSVERPAVAFSFKLPQGWGFRRADIPTVSPDGRMIVFSAYPLNDRAGHESALWIRSVDSTETLGLMGTEGGLAPFWSPDSRYVAFWQQGALKKVDVSSGAVSTLLDDGITTSGGSGSKTATEPRSSPIQAAGSPIQTAGDWGKGEVILVSQGPRLARLPAVGGALVLLDFFTPGETGQYNPRFLPDGLHFLYYSRNKNQQDNGIYVASLDSGAQRKLVLKNSTAAVYVSAGYLMFSRDGQMLAQHFDPKRFELTGDPLSLAATVGNYPERGSPAAAFFSASDDGVLVWRPADGESAPSQNTTQLTWFDRSGKRLGAIGEPSGYSGPAFSPDEQHLVVAESDPKTHVRDLWVLNLRGGGNSRFTADPVDEFNPVWSPDGKWIYFSAEKAGTRNIYRKSANGMGIAEPLLRANGEENVEDISPDGRFLLVNSRQDKQAEPDLTIVSLNGARKRITFTATQSREDQAQFSPNGHWIAYRSFESGNSEILVRGLMQNGSPSPAKWQVSQKGGNQPRWGADGKELFYIEGNRLMVVDIDSSGAVITNGPPKPLFRLNLEVNERRNRYLASRDGQRILVVSLTEAITGSTIAAQLNWPATLKQDSLPVGGQSR